MMRGWLSRVLNRFKRVPFPRSDEPRLPESVAEAERIFRRYRSLNGRYYLVADVVWEGELHLGVVFDGDSRIAVESNRCPVYQQPSLIGKRVQDYLITKDRSCGTPFGEADAEGRQHFAEKYGGPLP